MDSWGHSFRASVKCTSCRNQFQFDSASPDVNKRVVQSGLLSAIDYAEYSRFTAFMDMNTLSKSQFYKYADQLWEVATSTFETEQLQATVKYLEDMHRYMFGKLTGKLTDELHVIQSFCEESIFTVSIAVNTDFRWSQRRNALNGTLTVRTLGDLLIGRVNIMRTITDAETNDRRNFIGAAKSMEGAAVQKFLEEIRHFNESSNCYRIKIAAYVHDQDGCTSNLIRKQFPDALEFLDVGHSAKNIKKRVGKVARGYGEKSQVAFRKCIKGFTTVEDKKYSLRAYPFHFRNDHRFCFAKCPSKKDGNECAKDMLATLTDSEKEEIGYVGPVHKSSTSEEDDEEWLEATLCQTETDQNLPDQTQPQKLNIEVETKLTDEKFQKLKAIFFEYSNRAANYRYNIHTQKIEAGNHSMTVLANKRKFYRESYPGRIDASFLRLEKGDSAFLGILENTGLTVTKHMEDKVQKLDESRSSDLERKASPDYKQKRKENKQRKVTFSAKKKAVNKELQGTT